MLDIQRTVAFFLLLFSFNAFSQDENLEAERKQLLTILSNIETGLNQQDLDSVLDHFDNTIIITYLNAEVTSNHEGIRAYFNRMLKGDDSIVKRYETKAKVSAPATFHGNTAIAYGTAEEHYELNVGMSFDLTTHWSTTLVKKNNQWRVVALHFSSNLFENPLLENSKRINIIYGLAGILIGGFISFFAFRGKNA